MNLKTLKMFLFVTTTLLASSNVVSQTFSVSEESVVGGTSTVAVSWTWTAGSSVSAFGVDIVFDDAILTPQTTTVSGVETVDGCLLNVPAGIGLKGCNLINSTTIRLSLQNLGAPAAVIDSLSPGGTITFDIAQTASAGDSSSLALTLQSVVPAGTSVTLDNGKVDIVAGPAGALSIAPTSHAFGELLADEESGSTVFTVTSSGLAGSTITLGNPAASVAAPFAILPSSTCANGATLAQGATCTVIVGFEPTQATAALSELVTVVGVDGNGTSKQAQATVTGQGIVEARPTANPASGTSESEVVGPAGSNDFTVTFGNTGNDNYDVSCSIGNGADQNVWSVTGGTNTTVAPGATHTVTTTCTLPDTETYTATLSCSVGQQTFTYNYECVGLPPLPVPVDNKWALALLALMMLMAASFGFRFIARQ